MKFEGLPALVKLFFTLSSFSWWSVPSQIRGKRILRTSLTLSRFVVFGSHTYVLPY